ncbi:DUF2500 family protein [Paenibacillus pasadenensis]|uniref:DUF2500 family protein n=1 Tax=Paenibacillus pasadenensis TaxID=217090 RepID=UPI0033405AFF
MDNFIILFVVLFIVLSMVKLFTVYFPVDEFECEIRSKKSEAWKSMSVSSKMTSYTITVHTERFQEITIIVMSPDKYNKINIGDYGKMTVRGRFLIEFKLV